MNPQITAITLGVRDMDRAKQFYSQAWAAPLTRIMASSFPSNSATARRLWRSTRGMRLPTTLA
jgi:predicted enzyme related to lactoylglutathione lyase